MAKSKADTKSSKTSKVQKHAQKKVAKKTGASAKAVRSPTATSSTSRGWCSRTRNFLNRCREAVNASISVMKGSRVVVVPEATLVELNPGNVKAARAFFQYHDMPAPSRSLNGRSWTCLAYIDGILAGGIMAHLEKSRSSTAPQWRVYIDSLAVLQPYRRFKLGNVLVDWVKRKAEEMPLGSVRDTYLHTPTDFEAARRFYARLGFTELRVIKKYYRKVDGDHSRDAVILSAPVTTSICESTLVANALKYNQRTQTC